MMLYHALMSVLIMLAGMACVSKEGHVLMLLDDSSLQFYVMEIDVLQYCICQPQPKC